jgi:hypothetical protein
MSREEVSTRAEVVREAARLIDRSGERLQGVPRDTLNVRDATEAVRADLEALQTIPRVSPERTFAAATIGGNAAAHPTYRRVLSESAPEILPEANVAIAELAQRSAAKLERDGRAYQDTVVQELRDLNAKSASSNSPLESWETLKTAAQTNGLEAKIERAPASDNHPPSYHISYTDNNGRLSAIESVLERDGRTTHDSTREHSDLSSRDLALLRTISQVAHKSPGEKRVDVTTAPLSAEARVAEDRSAERASPNSIERGPEREAARPAPETIVLDAAGRERLSELRARDRESVGRAQTNAPGNDGQISERFITALDKRMEKSELEELGWKGRDDLNDVMRDLRKLASVDFQRASDMWSKYRPDDKDKPPFLDDDELSEARRRAARGAPKESEPAKEFVPPEHLRKRFLQVDDKYYFRHEDNKLAFRDHGNRIATPHDDAVVALSMIQLAEAKGWQSVNLKGSNEFKREAWLQASLKGMEVKGYSPRDVDIEKLAELQKELGPNPKTPANVVERTARVVAEREARTRPGDLPEKAAVVDEQRRTLSEPQRVVIDTIQTVLRQRGDSERAVSVAAAIAAEKFQNNRVYVGKVLEKGEAPYENDPKNEKSYYVKLQTPKGEKTVWGVDLKRSLEEGNIKVGDEVALANQGKQQVTVQVKSRDATTNEVKQSSIVTNRNVWDVRNIESLRDEAREKLQVAAERADRAPLIKVYDRAAQSEIVRPQVRIEPTRDSERSR